ncbi:MAG: hypothetical protein Q9227_004548 [Pyrenula ochraceoflavens]
MADLGSTTDVPAYLGVWTNWSRGRILGATLTTTHRNGALLTAFLAIFVTFVGTSFWRIASFALHQSLSSPKPRDGLYHQIQAILRNSGDGITSFTRLLQLLWAWRRHAHHSFYRIAPLAVITAACTAAFAVASIFSARISSGASDEVLISGSSCGQLYLGEPNTTLEMFNFIYNPYLSRKATSDANYVESCYSGNAEGEGYGSFIERQLPRSVDRNATCPFQENICRHKDQNIRIESELRIDADLGFNVPPNLQYTFKVVNHCAPLAITGHHQTFNYSDDIQYMRYSYGQANKMSDAINFTYQYPVASVARDIWEDFTTGLPDYTLGYVSRVMAYAQNGSMNVNESSFLPDKGFLQDPMDSDIVLMFLSANEVLYTDQVDDDWYAAHRNAGEFSATDPSASGEGHVYMSDEPASPLGCTVHYEGCYPSTSPQQGCPVSGGLIDVSNPWNPDEPGVSEIARVISWITSQFLDLNGVMDSLQISSLTSRHFLNQGTQVGLPDNQWQMEVEYWHDIGLASLQGIVSAAAGPDDPGIQESFWAPPNTQETEYLCKNQKIRSSAYTNFSVFGLAFVLVVGGIIIIIGYLLEPFLEFVESRRRKVRYSRLEWSANDILQTQRMAHQELGIGAWDNCAGHVPITQKFETLAVLDIQDPKLPRLKVPSAGSGEDGVNAMVDSKGFQVDGKEMSTADSVASGNEGRKSSFERPLEKGDRSLPGYDDGHSYADDRGGANTVNHRDQLQRQPSEIMPVKAANTDDGAQDLRGPTT